VILKTLARKKNMKSISTILMCSIVFTSTPLWSETYQWSDDDGVVHFSDNSASIPAKSRNKVKRTEDAASTYAPPPKVNKVVESAHNNRSDIAPNKYERGSAEFVALERQLIDSWNRMRQALKERNIETALSYFTESSRDSFRDEFTALRKKLPEIAEEMGETKLVKADDSFAECDLRRVENGTTFSYVLQFVRDYDGIWRIRTF
jgi:hypothetical protein